MLAFFFSQKYFPCVYIGIGSSQKQRHLYENIGANVIILFGAINSTITWQEFPQNWTGKYGNYNIIPWKLIHKLPMYHIIMIL